mgnify:CR=1 FL=1
MGSFRKLALAALALTAGFAVSVAQAKDWKKVTIATEGAYMPYNGHAPDGKLIGFEIDLAKDLCARMKVTCEVIAQDWNGIIPGLTGGKYDAIMAGMSITPKRKEVIAFSRPYVAAPSTFAAPKGGALAGLPETGVRVSLDHKAAMDAAVAKLTPLLKGKVIGAQVSTIQADLLNTYFKGVATIRTYPTTEEHDLDLEAGRLDAALASTSYFVSTLAKAGDQLQLSGPLFTGGLLGAGVGVGLRKGDADLKAMFDTAIEAALKDGTMKKLAIQWFKTDISAPM